MSSRVRSLEGQRIAVTGGARGIGLATARELHARGARVAIGDLDPVAAKQAADGIAPDVVGLALDVSDEESFAAFLDAARAELGGVDVLVNNAGIMPIGPFLEVSPEVTRRALEINLLGVLHGTRLALPEMVGRGSGHVVNVASTAGKSSVPGGLAYCATKAGVVSFTEGARVEFAGTGVHFTCVMPAFTNTDLIAGTSGVRFIRNVEPEDVATAIADAVAKPVPDVYVPRVVGAVLRSQPLLGRRLRDYLNRRLGAYDTFLRVDPTARRGYDDRISHS